MNFAVHGDRMCRSRSSAWTVPETTRAAAPRYARWQDATRQNLTTPLAYLHGLIRRAEAGTFAPEVGQAAAPRTSRVSPTSAESPPRATTPVQPSPLAYPDVTTNPLRQRIAEIQEKVAQRRAASVSSEPESQPATA